MQSKVTEGRESQSKMYPAVYRVAIFFAVNLALSALSSDSFLSTNPSPLHSEHIPEPPQSSHVFKGTCFLRKFSIRRISQKYRMKYLIMQNGISKGQFGCGLR